MQTEKCAVPRVDLPRERERLTRRETDVLLRLERGSKKIVADRADAQVQHLSRWLRDSNCQHVRIEREAEAYALEIAVRHRLTRDEVYWDKPERRPLPAEMKRMPPKPCVTAERKTVLA